MSDLTTDLDQRREKLSRLLAEGAQPLDEGLLLVQFPLLSGMLRAKLSRGSHTLRPEGFNAILYGLTDGDGDPLGIPVFESEMWGPHNGWPNIVAMLDPDTLVEIPWRPGVRAVMLNTYLLDGRSCPLDPRALVARQEARLLEHDLRPAFAFEYECVLYEVTTDTLEPAESRNWRRFGGGIGNFDMRRHGALQSILTEFMQRAAGIGAEVTDAHTEYGRGMIEFSLAPKLALASADAAARAKDCLAELCLEHGLVVTFMARSQPVGAETASGGHLHQSLWRDDRNVFAPQVDGELSTVAQRYLAGQLAHMAEWHLVYRPTINSYRRMDRTAWSPEEVSWGHENRTCAVRVITGPTSEHSRFELRTPGADASPHLTVAAALASGLDGIDGGMDLMPGSPGEPDPATAVPLTRTLADSISAFARSSAARAHFGDVFVDIYAASRKAELDAFDEWIKRDVTDFEFARYLRSM
jgi:glutamine synthetase